MKSTKHSRKENLRTPGQEPPRTPEARLQEPPHSLCVDAEATLYIQKSTGLNHLSDQERVCESRLTPYATDVEQTCSSSEKFSEAAPAPQGAPVYAAAQQCQNRKRHSTTSKASWGKAPQSSSKTEPASPKKSAQVRTEVGAACHKQHTSHDGRRDISWTRPRSGRRTSAETLYSS